MTWKISPIPEKKRGNFVQAGFRIFATVPIGIAGLFVVLLSGNGTVIAYLGPFAGFWAVMNLIGLVFQAARSLGATHWDHRKVDDNGEGRDS